MTVSKRTATIIQSAVHGAQSGQSSNGARRTMLVSLDRLPALTAIRAESATDDTALRVGTRHHDYVAGPGRAILPRPGARTIKPPCPSRQALCEVYGGRIYEM